MQSKALRAPCTAHCSFVDPSPHTPNGMPFNAIVRFRYNLITVDNVFCTAKSILPVANVGKSSILKNK
jgi:hypothetical protein